MADNIYKNNTNIAPTLKTNIDEKDRKILSVLAENARANIAEIVHKTGIQRDTVAYRLRKMEESKLIMHYHTLIDPEFLGYHYFAIVLVKLEPVPESELVDFQKKLQLTDNITHINKTIGTYDMVLYVVAKDAINFGEIINEIKNTPKKIISNLETLNIIHELKVDNFSGLI